MSEAFDPYHRWLGIAPKDQPPHHYRLLGIDLFEDDPEVIRDAAERQMAHVRKYQLGPHSAISQKILNELAAAKACLLNRDKKIAYEAAIKAKLNSFNSAAEQTDLASPPPIPLPWISGEQPHSANNPAKKAIISDGFKIIRSWRYVNKWFFLIGLGTAAILGGVMLSMPYFPSNSKYELSDNNRPSNNLDTHTDIMEQPDPIEKIPPSQPASNQITDNNKTAEPIIISITPSSAPSADNLNNASEKQGAIEQKAGGDIPETHKEISNSGADVNKSIDTSNNIQKVDQTQKKPIAPSRGKPNKNIKQPRNNPSPAPSSPNNKFQNVVDQFVQAYNDNPVKMRQNFADYLNSSWPMDKFTRTFNGLRANNGKIINYDSPVISKVNAKGIPITSVSANSGGIKITTTTPGYKDARQVTFNAYCDRGYTIEFTIFLDLQDKILGLFYQKK